MIDFHRKRGRRCAYVALLHRDGCGAAWCVVETFLRSAPVCEVGGGAQKGTDISTAMDTVRPTVFRIELRGSSRGCERNANGLSFHQNGWGCRHGSVICVAGSREVGMWRRSAYVGFQLHRSNPSIPPPATPDRGMKYSHRNADALVVLMPPMRGGRLRCDPNQANA